MMDLAPRLRRRLTLLSSGVFGLEALRQGAVCGSLGGLAWCGAAASAAFLLPTLVRNCTWCGPVVRQFQSLEREVWLTIDDGPDPAETSEILEVLERFNAVATFFVIGQRVQRWPHVAAAILSAGHALEAHTFSHPEASFWAAGPGRVRREIAEGMRAIAEVAGRPPTQFRAPVGLANPFVHATVAELGLQMIGWSAAGLDGVAHTPENVVRRVAGGIKPGAILLVHEGYVRGLKPGTRARTLDQILRTLRERGYRTVIPDLLRPSRG
jgi:peptidoglycan/xylan/chitin deacetylase (PgdA/CDA1 family)